MANTPSGNENVPLGGQTGLIQLNPETAVERGLLSNYPAMTPKFNTSNKPASVNSQARLFLQVANAAARNQLYQVITSAAAQDLLDVLAGTADGQFGQGYVDFLLARADEQLVERYQVVETLTDDYVTYAFGRHAPVWNFSGSFLNSVQDDWAAAFDILYNDVIRVSKMANIQNIVRLRYDNKIVSGVLVNLNKTIDAMWQLKYDFSFSMLVKRIDVMVSPTWYPTNLAGLGGVAVPFLSGFGGTEFSPTTFVPQTIQNIPSTSALPIPTAAQDAAPPTPNQTATGDLDDSIPIPETTTTTYTGPFVGNPALVK